MNTPLRLLLAAGALLAAPSFLRADEPAPAAKRNVAIIDGTEVDRPDIAMGDAITVDMIIAEGKDRSQVMRHLDHLTHKIGPRLTGSSRAEAANHWCREQYTAWGLSNPHIEEWGTVATRFDRGPSTLKATIKRTRTTRDGETEVESAPLRDLEFTTTAWTRGTDGPRTGPVVRLPQNEDEYKALKEADKLKGAWILVKAQPPAGRHGVQDRMSSNFQGSIDARKKVADGTKVEDLPYQQRILFDEVAGFISASRDELVRTGGDPRLA